jgi:hypothetical protein
LIVLSNWCGAFIISIPKPFCYPRSDFGEIFGLAIRMDTQDHIYRTGNWGPRKSSKRFRAEQKELVEQGRYDEALEMGVKDIREQNPEIYDLHIDEMMKSAPRNSDGSIDWSKFKRK